MSDALKLARAAKAKATRVLESLQVSDVAVGLSPVGEGSYELKINLKQALDEGVSIPKSIDGIPVRVEIVGPIKKR